MERAVLGSRVDSWVPFLANCLESISSGVRSENSYVGGISGGRSAKVAKNDVELNDIEGVSASVGSFGPEIFSAN